MSAESQRFVRLVATADGSSEFVDDELPMTSRDFAPPAAPMDVSDAMVASGVVFWRAPAGWDGRRHPAPARQWAYVLQGAISVESGHGETRHLGPGDGILLEDVTGDGHTTRVLGDEAASGVFIQVPE